MQLDEKRNAYLLQWAGVDPSTGEEWKPSWVSPVSAALFVLEARPLELDCCWSERGPWWDPAANA